MHIGLLLSGLPVTNQNGGRFLAKHSEFNSAMSVQVCYELFSVPDLERLVSEIHLVARPVGWCIVIVSPHR
jgi:hypothetical protein